MQELQRYANMPQKRKLSKEICLFQTSKMLHRHCTGDANTELDTSLTGGMCGLVHIWEISGIHLKEN